MAVSRHRPVLHGAGPVHRGAGVRGQGLAGGDRLHGQKHPAQHQGSHGPGTRWVKWMLLGFKREPQWAQWKHWVARGSGL